MEETNRSIALKVIDVIKMFGFSRRFYLDNTNEYDMIRSEMIFGLKLTNPKNYSKTIEPYKWIPEKLRPRFMEDGYHTSKYMKDEKVLNVRRSAGKFKNKIKNHMQKSKHKDKGQKCIHGSKKIKRRKKFIKIHKKYLIPVVLGLLAAKSLLLPIVLKAIALMAAKGLIMSFISTIFASVITIKGILDHSQRDQNKKEDTKTVVEVIHVPAKSHDHFYYDKKHKRSDAAPTIIKPSRKF